MPRKEDKKMPFDQFGNYSPYNHPAYQPRINQFQQNQNVYAFVNGLEGAKSYQVPPNQTVLLMDSEQPVCYMKTANGLGQGSLRYFKLQEVSESDIRGNANNMQASNYATKEELESLIKRIEKLEPKEAKNE